MSKFKVGDRVITTTNHPFPGPGLAGRVVELWGEYGRSATRPRVLMSAHPWKPRTWSLFECELTLAPSRRADVEPV